MLSLSKYKSQFEILDSTPVDRICVCLEGTLKNDLCTPDDGCIAPLILEDGSTLCYFCNITAGFKLRVNSQGNC